MKLSNFTEICEIFYATYGERNNNIPCPYGECLNQILHIPYLVKLHLLTNGLMLIIVNVLISM